MEISYSNAGMHIPPYLIDRKGEIKPLFNCELPITRALSQDDVTLFIMQR